MARITVDDCLKVIPNRFDLTLSAAIRARQIGSGAAPMVEANDDKATVIALRELAAGKYGVEILSNNRTDAAWGANKAADHPTVNSTVHEDAWQRITETSGEAGVDKVVSAQPA